MILAENFSLRNHNTFGIEARTRYFFSFSETHELITFLEKQEFKHIEKLILAGGSNFLFTKDFEGIIIHPLIKGIEIIEETSEHVILRAGAGEVWDNFIDYCISKNYGGIENLSLIPGHVGAVPVQNIGAYGAEVKDTIWDVEAIGTEDNKIRVFNNKECCFDYRDSVFKNHLKGKYIITRVSFKLTKKHIFVTHYGTVTDELEKFGEINLANIRQAIINIRRSKLPNPEEIGNAGSFFKNPIVPASKAKELKNQYSNIPIFPVSDLESKLAAGWLIDQCGWKGKRIGDAGVHKDQALVLVNHGNASGSEIFNLSQNIRQSVKELFGVDLETEVNII